MSDDYLFDIDCYKKGESVWQVRLCKSEEDQGEVIATFQDKYNCRLMRDITIPDGCDLIVTEFEVNQGILDCLDIWDL